MRTASHRVAMVMLISVLALAAGSAEAKSARTAQEPAGQGTAAKKFTRGVVNVLTGVLEIPRAMRERTHKGIEQGNYRATAITEGVVFGVIPGAAKALGRTASGVYDMATFPVDLPANYEPLYTPATVFAPGYWTPASSQSKRTHRR